MTARPRVVVIGGGFGGMRAVRGLREADVDVTLVDRANHHLFQPLLYQVSTALLPPGDIAAPLRRVFDEQHNVTVLMGEAVDLDVAQRTVQVATVASDQREICYDFLVVAVGAVPNYFGNDEWSAAAPPMKTVDDAVGLRDRILRALETAAVTDDESVRQRNLTFAVVGAGPTGVELAGQLAAMGRRMLSRQFAGLPQDEFRILLADAGHDVLAPFAAPLRQHTREKLQELGVEVVLGRPVVAVDDTGVTLGDAHGGDATGGQTSGGQKVAAATVIWAAGVKPAPFTARVAEAASASTDSKGRLHVGADCTLAGHPEIFAIGDAANHDDLPGIAEPAIQEGKHVARIISARLGGGHPPGPFRYRDLGTMATISPGDAVAQMRFLKLHGAPAKVAWAAVHLAFLVGWGHRGAVLGSWAWTLVTGRRKEQVMLCTVDSGSEQ
jgi:NADH:quinone reductase (non-electrogenic)